jgi:hypothetical protein
LATYVLTPCGQTLAAVVPAPQRPGSGPAPGPCENPALTTEVSMDIERINAIGTSLADLTERTAALRGYL